MQRRRNKRSRRAGNCSAFRLSAGHTCRNWQVAECKGSIWLLARHGPWIREFGRREGEAEGRKVKREREGSKCPPYEAGPSPPLQKLVRGKVGDHRGSTVDSGGGRN